MRLVRRRRAHRCKYRREHPILRIRTDNRPKKRRVRPHNHLYASMEWRRLRLRHLNANPICVLCGLPANEADHIVRHLGDRARFFDPRNLQSLCRACHIKKSIAEKKFGGRFRPL